VLPILLRGVRALEIAAVRDLLGVELPEPGPASPPWETRLRGAVWAFVHVVSGGLLATGLLSLVPMALVTVAGEVGIGDDTLRGQGFWWSGGPGAVWAVLAGLGALVLLLYAAGLSNAEIAERLRLGVETVKHHVKGVLTKFGTRDRTQAVIAAYEWGFVVPQGGRSADRPSKRLYRNPADPPRHDARATRSGG
jgi:DNA-binding CsgD family transcriptional regulator